MQTTFKNPSTQHVRTATGLILKMLSEGAGPVAEWLSSCVPLRWPRVCQFKSWVRTWHHSSGHAGGASHMPQLEGPTTKNTWLRIGGLWREKGKIKKNFLNDKWKRRKNTPKMYIISQTLLTEKRGDIYTMLLHILQA